MVELAREGSVINGFTSFSFYYSIMTRGHGEVIYADKSNIYLGEDELPTTITSEASQINRNS